MRSNLTLLNELFAALNAHDHAAMAHCYHVDARFTDIAFDLHGRRQIHAMWRRFADTDLYATVNSVFADDAVGQASYVDDYTFTDTGRSVHNEIEGRFRFQNGLILKHRDRCDPLIWARQAYGGVKGEFVGRIACVRRCAAKKKIADTLAKYPDLD